LEPVVSQGASAIKAIETDTAGVTASEDPSPSRDGSQRITVKLDPRNNIGGLVYAPVRIALEDRDKPVLVAIVLAEIIPTLSVQPSHLLWTGRLVGPPVVAAEIFNPTGKAIKAVSATVSEGDPSAVKIAFAPQSGSSSAVRLEVTLVKHNSGWCDGTVSLEVETMGVREHKMVQVPYLFLAGSPDVSH
jgi:hypothetical protein